VTPITPQLYCCHVITPSQHQKVQVMLKFSEDHEWARLDAEICSVGISPHAVEQLGDIVFVELPEIGTIIDKGDEVAVIESVKAASDIYSPAAGQITDVNNALLNDLSSITPESAMENWLFKLKISDISDLDQLMDEDAYKASVG
jgi:glycine cleavage system H protein